MRRPQDPPKPWRPTATIGIALVGLMIFVLGLFTLVRGGLYYFSYWGGFVFAPFAILIGALTVFVAYKKGVGS